MDVALATHAAAFVGAERNNGFAAEVVRFQKGSHRHREAAPPVGVTEVNHIVIFHAVYRGGKCRTSLCPEFALCHAGGFVVVDRIGFYRIYFKTTDFNGLPLSIEEYRVRLEETYSGDALLKLNGGQPVKIRDFATVIKGMSKALSFTKLKDNAFPYFRSGYRDIAAPYGLKKETKQGLNGIKKTRRNNGNVRPLSKYLVTYTEFNQKTAKAQHKLAEKFLIKN